jgi:hypothetical protein
MDIIIRGKDFYPLRVDTCSSISVLADNDNEWNISIDEATNQIVVRQVRFDPNQYEVSDVNG